MIAHEQIEALILFEVRALRHRLGNRSVRRMLRKARLPLPAGLPPIVTVWRGGLGTPETLARGLSWTMKRGAAAKYAQRLANDPRGDGAPCVIAAEIPRERMLFYSDSHFEAELIFAGEPRNVRVDGDPAIWPVWFEEWRAAANAEWMLLLEGARAPNAVQQQLLAQMTQEIVRLEFQGR